MCATSSLCGGSPAKGDRPASSSYATQPKGVHVRSVVGRGIAAGGLLGRHVGGRPHRGAELRQRRARRCVRRCRDGLRDSEVCDDGGVSREEHVVGLDVAMHDATLVRVRKRARDVAQNAHRLGDRQRPAAKARAKALAFDVWHGIVRKPLEIPRREHRDDIGLLERGRDADLALEARGDIAAESSGERSLTTTLRPRRRSSATNTRDMPPPPSSRSMV